MRGLSQLCHLNYGGYGVLCLDLEVEVFYGPALAGVEGIEGFCDGAEFYEGCGRRDGGFGVFGHTDIGGFAWRDGFWDAEGWFCGRCMLCVVWG